MAKVMNSRDWGLLVSLSILWGGSFYFAEVAIRDLGPLTVVAGRVSVGALGLLAAVYAVGLRMPASLAPWRQFTTMGLLNNVLPFSLIVWGQTSIDSSLAAILNATTPMFSVVLAHIWVSGEQMTPNRIAGVGLGIAGVALLVGPSALSGLGDHLGGQLAVLAAACCYAVAAIYGRRLGDHPPIVSAAGQVTASAVIMMPVCLIAEAPWTAAPSAETMWAIAGIGLLCTALAYAIYFRILSSAGPTNLMLVTLLVPLSATGLGILFLGEKPGPEVFVGMALILAGLAAIDGRVLGLIRPSRAARSSRRRHPQE